MWIEDVNGDLVNLEHALTIEIIRFIVFAILPDDEKEFIALFESDDPAECQAYMEQLKKELAAFGKLVKVVLSD